jgi:hypothetical protein
MGINSGLIHPLLMGLTGQRPTLSQKHQGGWTTFAKQWQLHMQVVLACNKGIPIPDLLPLQYIKPSLDTSDQLMLENLLETNPRLSFTDFWGHMSGIYDGDSQAQLRLQWESVKIAQGELNLDKWLHFLR